METDFTKADAKVYFLRVFVQYVHYTQWLHVKSTTFLEIVKKRT